jgi:hypothetical protein
MKTKYINLLFAISILAFSSCDKSAFQVIDAPPTGPNFRVYNFAVNGPQVNVYVNDVKASAIGSTTGKESASGIAAYGIFPGTNSYVNLQHDGSVTIKAKTPVNATTNPGVETTSATAKFENGKFYSFFTTGIYNATAKTTGSFVIEDVLPAIDINVGYARMINTVPNAPSGFDLKATNKATGEVIVISNAVPFQSASPFVKLPEGIYNLTSTSVNTPLSYTITRADLTISKGFVYTLAARGTVLTTSTLAIDMTRNR